MSRAAQEIIKKRKQDGGPAENIATTIIKQRQNQQVTALSVSATPFLSPEEEAALKMNEASLDIEPSPADTEAEAIAQYPTISLSEETEKATKNLLLDNWKKLQSPLENTPNAADARQKAIEESAGAIMNITHRNYLLAQENKAKQKEGAAAAYTGESYADAASRDMVIGMLDAATSIDAIATSVGALSNLAVGLKGDAHKEMQFAEHGDKILGTFKKATTSRQMQHLARGVTNLVYENEEQRSLVAKDGEVVGKLLSAIGNNNFEDRTRGNSLSCLQSLFFTKEMMQEVGFDTQENFDKIFDAARNLTDEHGRGGALNMLTKMSEAHPEFLQGKENAMKEMLLGWSQNAQSPWLISNISSSLQQFSKLQEEPASTQDIDTRDTLFTMGRAAKGPEAIAAVAVAIANVAWEINKKREGLSPEDRANFDEIYGDEKTHEFFQEMIGRVDKLGSKEGDKARGAIAGAIASVCLGDKAAARFCNEDTKKTMLDWGNRAKTDEGIAGVAAAISSMAYYEGRVLEQNRSNVFAQDSKVKDALAAMKAKLGGTEVAHTNKSTQDRAASQIDVADKNIDWTNEKAKSGSWVAKVQQGSSDAKEVGGLAVAASRWQ